MTDDLLGGEPLPLSNAVMPAGKRASDAMAGKLRSVRGVRISAIPAEMTSTTENPTNKN